MMKNIYNGSNSPPSNIYRVVDGNTKKIQKAWRAVSNTEYVKVWDITSSKELILNISRTPDGVMKVQLLNGKFKDAQYEYDTYKVDWGDNTTDEMTSEDSNLIHVYDTSINTSSIKINGPISKIWHNFVGGGGYQNIDFVANSVIIPDSVTEIDSKSFEEWVNCVSINIPNSVTSIGNYAFQNVPATLKIPDSVTSIGSYAFYNTKIESINLSKLVNLEQCAFEYCTELTKININFADGYIKLDAFRYCDKLISVKITGNVKYIADGAFRDCTNLTEITIPNIKVFGRYVFSANTHTINYNGTVDDVSGWNMPVAMIWERNSTETYQIICTDGVINV